MPKFNATLRAQEMVGMDAWTFLPLPPKVVAAFDSRARTAVRGTLNGVAFRSSIFPDGDGGFHMMVNAKLRAAAKAGPGDRVRVEMERDDAPRTTKTPPDLTAALKRTPGAKAFWKTLTPSQQKLYVEWIEEAKRPETKVGRVSKTTEMLLAGKKRAR